VLGLVLGVRRWWNSIDGSTSSYVGVRVPVQGKGCVRVPVVATILTPKEPCYLPAVIHVLLVRLQ
jgi:hypothetical protein